eukprot:269150_1
MEPKYEITCNKLSLYENMEYLRLITFAQLRDKIYDISSSDLVAKLSLNSLMSAEKWKKHWNQMQDDMKVFKYRCRYCNKGYIKPKCFEDHVQLCKTLKSKCSATPTNIYFNNNTATNSSPKAEIDLPESNILCTAPNSIVVGPINDKSIIISPTNVKSTTISPTVTTKSKKSPRPFKYKCPQCLKPYRTWGPLVNHLKRVHSVSAPPNKPTNTQKTIHWKHSHGSSQLTTRKPSSYYGFSKLPNGIKGHKNVGLTCWMNSVNQCIMQTLDLDEYFTSKQYLQDINETNEYGYKLQPGALIKAFANMRQASFNSETAIYDPTEFQQTIEMIDNRWRKGVTQDAQEYCVWALQKMHQDVNEVSNPPRISYEEAKVYYDERVAHTSWESALSMDKSIFMNTFYGQSGSTKQCEECLVISTLYNGIFSSIDLEIVKSNTSQVPTIVDCLKSYVKLERLQNNDRKRCVRCDIPEILLISAWIQSSSIEHNIFLANNIRTVIVKLCNKYYQFKGFNHKTKISLVQMPNILIISLKRFDYENNMKKIKDPVTFPIENMNLSELVYCKTDIIYDLYGIVNHYGEGLRDSYSHYTAHVKSLKDKQWWLMNDSRRPKLITNPKNVVTNNAYLLFFKRRNLSTKSKYITSILQQKPDHTILSKIDDFHLAVKDFKKLKGGLSILQHNWLNDECMNAYMRLLQRKNQNVAFFLTFFYEYVVKKNFKRCNRICQKMIKKLIKRGGTVNTIFEFTKLIFPIHWNQTHWITMTVENRSETFHFSDSIYGYGKINYGLIKTNFENWLKPLWNIHKTDPFPTWKLNDHQTDFSQQVNGIDCGVFAIEKSKQEIQPDLVIKSEDKAVCRFGMTAELMFNNDYGVIVKHDEESDDSDLEVYTK